MAEELVPRVTNQIWCQDPRWPIFSYSYNFAWLRNILSYQRSQLPLQFPKGVYKIGEFLMLLIWIQCCAVLNRSVMSDSLWPHELLPARLLCPCGFSQKEYWSGLLCLPPGDLPDPGIKPRSPTLQADSLPSVPPGKSKNTGEGSLPLLQGNFPVQESNQGLLHCRRILHQLNHQGALWLQ